MKQYNKLIRDNILDILKEKNMKSKYHVAKNKKEGYAFEQLSAGKFKDSGSSDLPLTLDTLLQ